MIFTSFDLFHFSFRPRFDSRWIVKWWLPEWHLGPVRNYNPRESWFYKPFNPLSFDRFLNFFSFTRLFCLAGQISAYRKKTATTPQHSPQPIPQYIFKIWNLIQYIYLWIQIFFGIFLQINNPCLVLFCAVKCLPTPTDFGVIATRTMWWLPAYSVEYFRKIQIWKAKFRESTVFPWRLISGVGVNWTVAIDLFIVLKAQFDRLISLATCPVLVFFALAHKSHCQVMFWHWNVSAFQNGDQKLFRTILWQFFTVLLKSVKAGVSASLIAWLKLKTSLLFLENRSFASRTEHGLPIW